MDEQDEIKGRKKWGRRSGSRNRKKEETVKLYNPAQPPRIQEIEVPLSDVPFYEERGYSTTKPPPKRIG